MKLITKIYAMTFWMLFAQCTYLSLKSYLLFYSWFFIAEILLSVTWSFLHESKNTSDTAWKNRNALVLKLARFPLLKLQSIFNFKRSTDRKLENPYMPLKLDSELPKYVFYLLLWKPLKKDEKWFLFHIERSFRSQDI